MSALSISSSSFPSFEKKIEMLRFYIITVTTFPALIKKVIMVLLAMKSFIYVNYSIFNL